MKAGFSNKYKIIFSLIAFVAAGCLFFTMSCEKTVQINMSSSQPQLVVEGFIENGNPPVVALTRSIGYFEKIDLATLSNTFVHDAHITVSDGSRTVTLREYSVDTIGGNKLFFYSLDSADHSSFTFLGETNKYYKLSIETGGKTYEATTKICACKAIDSLVAEPLNPPLDKLPDAQLLAVYYTDPDTFGNMVRYFTKRNSDPFYPGFNSVYDDQIVNGSKNARIPIAAGFARTGGPLSDSAGYVFKGDTVTLRWSAIDRGVYKFYNTYEYSLGTIGNPFSTPINVQSNISNGALGVWAGYGSKYFTIVIPK